METPKQPWLYSLKADSIFILLPPFLALFAVLLFPNQFKVSAEMPVFYWVILIVFIDVAHVYSTLYRTYFNPDSLKKQSGLLIGIPLVCYVAGALLYSFSDLVFWRLLAYLAVFHFIRQQYGFMRLYSRKEKAGSIFRLIDKIAIYTATIYPLLYWHLSGKRNFNRFVEGDFLTYQSDALLNSGKVFYLFVVALYILREVVALAQHKPFNIPRNLLIAGTFLSWYFGIVHYNGDMAVTTLNVVSHGIPYMALIWIFEKNKHQSNQPKSRFLKLSFGKYGIAIFLAVVVAFAYFEEGLWDGLVWREHMGIFQIFSNLQKVETKQVLALLIPLLALPQTTHYVLDGFIWKLKKNGESIAS